MPLHASCLGTREQYTWGCRGSMIWHGMVYDSGWATLVESLLNNFDCAEHDASAYLFDDQGIQGLLGRYMAFLKTIAEGTRFEFNGYSSQSTGS
jgi:hypothetical protein